MSGPVSISEDRSILIPPGKLVQTGYVSVWHCRLGCRDRMAIGDVERAFNRRLQLGDHQSWPPPRGHWDDTTFVIEDGRHEYVAALMCGLEMMLVAWLV